MLKGTHQYQIVDKVLSNIVKTNLVAKPYNPTNQNQ